jgi:soluble lytic murein transglycosylase
MREESAFKPRAVSPASAYGLMQLIEPTARRVAGPLNLPSNPEALKRPEVNIALGSRFLSDMMRSFDENQLLVIPGYNAGPGAPARWLKNRPSEDFDLWVERIPYPETRNYTKNVIQSMAAYAVLYGRGFSSPLVELPLRVQPDKDGSVTAN